MHKGAVNWLIGNSPLLKFFPECGHSYLWMVARGQTTSEFVVMLLAAQVSPEYVECYPWKEETDFGSELEENVEVPLHGKIRNKIVYKKEERVLIRPRVRAFILIVEDYKEDFERYIDTIKETTGILGDTNVFTLPRRMYKSQMIRRLKGLKWLRERYSP